MIADLTPARVSAMLGGRVDAVTAERVGTGQIGTCFRLSLSGPDVGPGGPLPTSVLAKLPAEDPGARSLLAGVYRAETRFYAELAGTVAVRVPACYHASPVSDDGDFVLLLADLAPAEQGDQLAGCSVAQARDAVENLAGLHGPRWCDATLLDVEGLSLNGPDDAALLAELYGPATDLFVDGLGPLLSASTVETLRACVEVCEAWALGRAERFGLMHGDYRLDNLLFPADGAPGVWAVDWQTLSLALPARDLAYLTGTGLAVADRRAAEESLVAAYHATLVGHGVRDYSLALCWDDYRYAMLQGPLVSVFGCAYGTRTERGDAMFAVMVDRACTAIRDLGSLLLV